MILKNNNIFFFFIYIINFISCSIYIPIETLPENNYIYYTNKDNNEHTKIIEKDFFNELYTIFEIGNPSQKIFLFIRTSNQDFNIISKNNYNENSINVNNKYNLSEFYKKYSLFNEKNSESYINEECKEILGLSDDFETICDSYDDFIFNKIQSFNATKKIKINNFSFKLIKETDRNIPGILGLGLFDKSRNPNHNFLKILKNYNLIDNYYFYFDFNSWNSTKGKLIIGSLPHEIDKNKFSENDLYFTNVFIESFDLKKWRIKFDEININNQFKLLNKKAEFDFDTKFIIGTNDLELYLYNKIFNNFIFNKMCFNGIFNYSKYFGYKFYYCKKDLKRTLFDLLPKIKFFLKEFNYTFEIEKEELFKIENNFIYFNIIFPKQKTNDLFILGKCFILKYQFVFNPDLQQIGFYKNQTNKLITINDKNDIFELKNIFKIFVVIVLIIAFVLILKFIKPFGVDKKKKNKKFIENYDYDNKNVDENNYNNFIEMKINT